MYFCIKSIKTNIDYGFEYFKCSIDNIESIQIEPVESLKATIMILTENNLLQTRFGKLAISIEDGIITVNGDLVDENSFSFLRGIYKNFLIARGYIIV